MMLVLVLAFGALNLFLTLAVLGAMREVALLRGEMRAFEELIKRPPPPSFVEDRVPPALADVLDATLPSRADGRLMAAFVSPGCRPCEDLVTELSLAVEEGRLQQEDLFFVAWALTDEAAERFAPDLPGHVVVDRGGSLARSCEIRATPTVFIVSAGDYKVLDFDLEGEAQWVINHLIPAEPIDMAT